MKPVEPKSNLGKLIRSRRLSLGLTQKQLADKLGLTLPSISAYESGRVRGSEMNNGLLDKFATALEYPAEDIKKVLGEKIYRHLIPKTELGKIVLRRRLELKLSRKTLAQRMGFHPTNIGLIERGRTDSILDYKAEMLAKSLDMDISKLEPFIKRFKTKGGRPLTKSTTRLGAFVREKRLEMGLSETELAEKLGYSRQYVSLVEIGGSATLSRSDTLKLAEVLNVEPSKLDELKERNLKIKKPKSALADFIIQQRCKHGWTMLELANKSGISTASICSIENDHHPPRPLTMFKICSAFGVEVPTDIISGIAEISAKKLPSEDLLELLKILRLEDETTVNEKVYKVLRYLLEKIKDGYSLRLAKGKQTIELELFL